MRIGNRAARAAQLDNRARGIPNWYSLAGRIVSDRLEPPAPFPPDAPSAGPATEHRPDHSASLPGIRFGVTERP